MLSPEQQMLLHATKEALQAQEAAGQHVPCFGFYLDKDGAVREQTRNCVPGSEEKLFSWVVEQLELGVQRGATCTALVVPLARTPGETEGGVMVDLQQRIVGRLVGVLPWSLDGNRLTFGETSFTSKAAVLFGAA